MDAIPLSCPLILFTRLRRKPRLPVLRSSLLQRVDEAAEECAAGVLRSLGEGGHASAGFAEDTRGTTAVKPWDRYVEGEQLTPFRAQLKTIILQSIEARFATIGLLDPGMT